MKYTDQGLAGLLYNVLADMPRLDGALCVGRADLFDPKHEHEDRVTAVGRHVRAKELCAECPAFTLCDDWAGEQPRDGQVLAGRVRRPGNRRETA